MTDKEPAMSSLMKPSAEIARRSRQRVPAKPTAQAMLEFALALPVLLTIVYGLIETGRLLFIYASTVTAARQAVRYGSATGVSGAGVPYFQDCDGIRGAVHNVGFINRFENDDIHITYDRGLSGTDVNGDLVTDFNDIVQIPNAAQCDDGFSGFDIRNGDRISVEVSTEWVPIVPILPFKPFTITTDSSRTILSSVAIYVTAPASGWSGSGGGELTLGVSASPGVYEFLDQPITYTYTLTNSGSGDLSPAFEVIDEPVGSINCSTGAPDPLTAGNSHSCEATYLITQEDLDNGFVLDLAQASANNGSVFSNLDGTTVVAIQNPKLSLTKTGDPAYSSVVGNIVEYTFTLTNSGNVTLRTPYEVLDDKTNDESCPGSTSWLIPGDYVLCTAHFTISQGDINATRVINHATATALFRSTEVTSNEASFIVYTPPVYLILSPSVPTVDSVGDTITYTYILRNSTDSAMSAPYTVTDSKVTGIDCSGAAAVLAPGLTTECVGTYTVTQADLDAGLPIVNTATATAKQGAQTRSSQEVTGTVVVTHTPALSLQVAANPASGADLGTVVTYTYTLTNAGTVTLSPAYVITDDKITGITCQTGTIAPNGGTKTCTGTRTITVDDVSNGSVINTATATAQFNGVGVASSSQTATVTTYTGPRLRLEKTASTDVAYLPATIDYTYTLRNTGGVVLDGPFEVQDNKLGDFICDTLKTSLAIGESATCTKSATPAGIGDGSIVNVATAEGVYGGGEVKSSPVSATVYLSNFACSIKHSALQKSPFRMQIFNHNTFPVVISSVTVDFNDTPPPSQFITSLVLGGNTIWTNALNHGAPAYITALVGNTIIAPNTSPDLVVNFNDSYTPRAPESIVIHFSTSGCGPLSSSDPGQQE
jgi:hypothetical protein